MHLPIFGFIYYLVQVWKSANRCVNYLCYINRFLSCRIRKWAYALIEYDLVYESVPAMISQVIADFIINHRFKDEENVKYVSVCQ